MNMKKINLIFVYLVIFILVLNLNLITAEETKTNTNTGEITLGNTKIKSQIKPEDSGDSKKYNFKDGGSLTADYNGKTFEYSDLKSVTINGNSKNPEITFDKDGKVVEAYFETGKDGKYMFGNEAITLPKGSKVAFTNGKVNIQLPGEQKADSKLIPESVDGKPGESKFYFSNDKGNIFQFEGGQKFTGVLGVKNGKFFFDSDVTIDDIKVSNPEKVDTYLDFKGEVQQGIKGHYLSMNKLTGKLVLGSNIDERGPIIQFSKDNSYGIRIDNDKDHVAMRALGNLQGSYISIQSRMKTNQPSEVEALNQVVMDGDNMGVFYNSNTGQLHMFDKGGAISELGSNFAGTTTVPYQVKFLKTDSSGQIVPVSKYNNIFAWDNENGWGYGSNPHAIKTTAYNSQSAPGLYHIYSDSWSYFYERNAAGLQKFSGIKIFDEYGVTKNPEKTRMMMDVLASMTDKELKSIKTLSFTGGNVGWAGLTYSNGDVYLSVPNGGYTPGVARHEFTHALDFAYGRNGAFYKDWMAVGGNRPPYTYDYGYTDYEDTSTFGEYTYKDSKYWNTHLNSGFSGYKSFRGRVAVFTKYGFLTRDEATRILSSAGLSSDDASLQKYIQEAKS